MTGNQVCQNWVVEKNGYDIIPEDYDEDEFNAIINENEMHREADGWSKDRTLRKIGSLPISLIYNYCYAHGIPNHKINEWMNEDNGKNVRKLLDEFPKLKCVDEKLSAKKVKA